ncbi:hypothetical protein HWV62_12108 [Athelia sp. TMB]|nr:hypothetical protein HWV62_12108 [Athelia sp. TMB]
MSTFLAPTYLATIQTACPWILRHLAAAAVLVRQSPPSPSNPQSTRVKHALEEIVKVIRTEVYQYSDPLMRFSHYLYVDLDFKAAQRALSAAEGVVDGDFFLGGICERGVVSARGLGLERAAEARMGADVKIDLEKNVIEINRPPLPVYQSIIENTRGLVLGSQAMGAAMTRPPPPFQQQAPATVGEERTE